MKRILAATIAIGIFSALSVPASASGEPQTQPQVQTSPEVIQEDHHDTSIALRELILLAPSDQAKPAQPSQALPWRRTGPPIISSEPDSALQAPSSVLPSVSASNFLTFSGISNRDNLVPPDPNAAVGATQIVETVNISYQIFSKAGASVFGPAEISTLWNGFGGQCDPTVSGTSHFYSDPIVLYDRIAGRWLVTIIGSSNQFFSANDMECIAVSTTSDATGSYHRYAFSYGTNLNDYPKFGIWPDAYYASYNIFAGAATFTGAQACAYNRTAMLSGGTATAVCFQRSTSDMSFLPSNLDGATLPPSGEPNFFLELATSTSLSLFRFHVDFSTPSNSTFTGPTSITVASYSEACGGAGSCIPQSGTSQVLDSLGDRLMHRLAYRNFGDHESLVVDHSVAAGSSTGVRWYEIRSPNGTPTVYQQGTFAPDSNYRWMGSIAMDKSGNMALGYSASSSSMFPAIRFTGRFPTDPLGTMEAEDTIIAGGGSQTGFSRWGDYTSMAIDPVDDLTFVYTDEYYATSSSFGWTTEIASFQLTPPSTVLLLNYYDQKNTGFSQDNVHVSNPNSSSTDATVVLGSSGQILALPANGDEHTSFAGEVGGPVFITGNVVLTASQRVFYNSSFSEVYAQPNGAASTQLLLNWYDQFNPGFSQVNIHLANPSPSAVTATVAFGANSQTVTVPGDGIAFVNFPGKVGGPVFITASGPVLASTRTVFYQTFNEVNAVPLSQASTEAEFSWYDQVSTSGLTDNIHISNPNSSSATATVSLAGTARKTVTIAADGEAVVNLGAVQGGPLTITSNLPVIASQRVTLNQAFGEVYGVASSLASTKLILNWYDLFNPGFTIDNVHLVNPSTTASATVTVTIGSSSKTVTVGPNGATFVNFSGVVGGPIFITSTSPVLSSARVRYYGSINEVNAVPLH